MSDWGLIDKIHEAGGVVKKDQYVFRWSDGREITSRPGKDWVRTVIDDRDLRKYETNLLY